MRFFLGYSLLIFLLFSGCTAQNANAGEQAERPSPAETTVSLSAQDGDDDELDEFQEQDRDVPFVPSPDDVVEAMLNLGEVTESDVVIDLGSGDGRIVIGAALRGARAIGVELDPKLVEESRNNAEEKGVSELTEFRQGDIFEADLSGATVVTIYLLPAVNEKILPKLLDELEPGTRLVSHSFDMGRWKPEQKLTVDGRTIYLWTIPTADQRPEGY